MRKLNCALLLLVWATAARADWSVTDSQTERGKVADLEHRRIVLAETERSERATLDLALFSTKTATLRVIDNPSGTSLTSVMQRERCLSGVNGGYFDPENAPVGLLISDGKVVAPLRKARLLSGVALISNGRLQLLRFGEYSSRRNASAAVQCGPLLVDHGQVVIGLDEARPARRTFIAIGTSDRAAIGFCSEVTLAEMAKILMATGIAADWKVQRALNLDGGSSSAFWFEGQHGAFSIPEQKTVRDFVAVVPR